VLNKRFAAQKNDPAVPVARTKALNANMPIAEELEGDPQLHYLQGAQFLVPSLVSHNRS
jgi:hypothetical protein